MSHMGASKDLEESLINLMYSMKRKSRIRKAISRSLRRCGDAREAVRHLGLRYKCCYIDFIVGLLMSDAADKVQDAIYPIEEIKKQWAGNIVTKYKYINQIRLRLFEVNLVVGLINYYIVINYNTKYATEIFVFLTIAGLLLYELVNYFCIKDYRADTIAGNLAFFKWGVLVALLSSENSINDAIILSYDSSPREIRLKLKELVDDLRKNKVNRSSYLKLSSGEIGSVEDKYINEIYKNRRKSGEEVMHILLDCMQNCIIDAAGEKLCLIKKKTQTLESWVKKPYEIASSLGIMFDVIMILGISLK